MKAKAFASGLLLLCALTTVLTSTEKFGLGPARAQTSELPTLALQPFVSGVSAPIGITHAGDGSGRVFIIEQGGRIRVVKDNALLATPFLDISTRITSGGERGLLGSPSRTTTRLKATSTSTTRTGRRHRHLPLPAERGQRRRGRPGERADNSYHRPALRQPQRRAHGLRPARQATLRRHGRRRSGATPATARRTFRASRQDAPH